MAARVPDLGLTETDAVKIETYVVGHRSARSKVGVVADLDFTIVQTDGESGLPMALLEMKTGPASVESMREFQLDVNDYNDIRSAVEGTGLPAYLVHVQVTSEIVPPTSRALAVDLWWTDVITLRNGFLRLAKRRDESKMAAYFSTSIFRQGNELVTELADRKFVALSERLRPGLPELPE